MELKKFKLCAELPNVPGAEADMIEECLDDCEAMHYARDFAWDLYGQYEDKREEIPSYATLVDKHRMEWFDLSTNEFERAIDDLYVRTVENQIDYWIEEVEDND